MPPEGSISSSIHFTPGPGGVEDLSLDLVQPGTPIIDVRSPGEFQQDHIPGSVNVPLLRDHERAVVGTLYRTEGKDSASRWALENLSQRTEIFLNELRSEIGNSNLPVICCARGGDRSLNVVQFLNQNHISARRLTGGYRSYRKKVIDGLASIDINNLWVLDGLTGAGKTAVLEFIANRYPDRILDLESYAGHRSSILGDVGKSPTTQKQFESLLFDDIAKLDGAAPWVLIEGESRKVGNRQIPDPLWQLMQRAPRVELCRDRNSRAHLLVDEYRTDDGWDPVIERLEILRSYESLGSDGVDRVQHLLREGKPLDAAVILLEKHYDPRYLHGCKGKRYRFTIEQEQLSDAALQLLELLPAGSG